jgi:hypothetical protein
VVDQIAIDPGGKLPRSVFKLNALNVFSKFGCLFHFRNQIKQRLPIASLVP